VGARELLIGAGFRPGDDANAEVLGDGVLIRPLHAEEAVPLKQLERDHAWLPPVAPTVLRAA
jgi:hypothetical protein